MENKYTTIELIVNNHAGVMSHITGLFSRRGYNLEGILCGSMGDGSKSRMYLLVDKDGDKLDQIIKQLQKLYDVIELHEHPNYDQSVFFRLEELVKR